MIPYIIAGILAEFSVIFLSGFLKNRIKEEAVFCIFSNTFVAGFFSQLGLLF